MIHGRTVVAIALILAGCSKASERPKQQIMSEAEIMSEAKNLFQKGSDLLDSDPAQAIEFLTKSLELNPDFPPALHNRASAYARVGRDVEAVADAERLEAVAPEMGKQLRGQMRAAAGGYTSIAEEKIKAKDFQGAIEKCNAALIYNPKWGDAWVVKGLAYEGLDDPKKALECFNNGAKVEPSNFFAYINRANLHLKEKRLQEALADFTKSIELEPTDSDAYTGRSAVYLALQMPEKAVMDDATAKELKKKQEGKKGD